jgi:type VI secretion system protein ImpC
LALPRVLLRVPYGPGTDEIDSFELVEMPPGSDHESYLWGSAAWAVALLLGRAFDDAAWEMSPGDVVDLADLPAHVYEEDGERKLKPCAEALLNERAMTQVLEAGPMPVVSFADRNAVRVPRLQSIASPATALAGPWG